MKRTVILLLCIAVLMSMLTGCRNEKADEVPELSRVRESGTMKIGVMVCPPFVYCIDGVWSGFDISLASEVCAKIGITPEFVEIDWNHRTSALENGDVDCLWCGISISETMQETFTFSQPYLVSRPVLITRKDSMDFTSIAVEKDSGTMEIARAFNTGAELVPVSSCSEAVSMVEQGRTDCALTDVLYAASLTSSDLDIRWDVELDTQQLGAAFRKDSDMVSAVNKALAEMERSGALNNLAERYQMTDNLIMG